MSGLKKMFNSETINGRANVAKATYGAFVLLFILNKFRKRKGQVSDEMCAQCKKREALLDGHGGECGGECSDSSTVCERPGANKGHSSDHSAKDSKGHGH